MLTFAKMLRSVETDELQESCPNGFLLLAHVARHARYTPGGPHGLDAGEALVGNFRRVGINSPMKYRTAIKQLVKRGFITIRATNKGTIAKIIDSTVFDLNLRTDNEQETEHPTSGEVQNDDPDVPVSTTNKEFKEFKRKKPKRTSAPPRGADTFADFDPETIRLHRLFCELRDVEPRENSLRKWLEAWRWLLQNGIPSNRLEAEIRFVTADVEEPPPGKTWTGWRDVIMSATKFREKRELFKHRVRLANSQTAISRCPRARYDYAELKSLNGTLANVVDPCDIVGLPDEFQPGDVPDSKKFCTAGGVSGWNPNGKLERFELYCVARFEDGSVEVVPLQERCPNCCPEASARD